MGFNSKDKVEKRKQMRKEMKGYNTQITATHQEKGIRRVMQGKFHIKGIKYKVIMS